MNQLDLPAGLSHRPLTMADVPAVVAVMAAHELAAVGEVVVDEADIVGDWSRPSFDLAASTVGVFDGDALLGYAEVAGTGRGDACVHPDQEGRGIGTALARWMQDTARAQGQSEIGMPVPEGSAGERLLQALGYRVRWNSWVLRFPADHAIAEQPLPPGYRLEIATDADVEAVYHVVEDAFLEWSRRAKQTLADWSAQVVGRPGHEPWNLQLVRDPGGAVVGGVHVVLDHDGTGFVNKVAVRADQRGLGLARALLAAAFASARAVGGGPSELSTDSRTGALDLYLGLGMEIYSTWVNYGIDL
ncbi:MAG: GNAT family N-acetyltransferase [Marmoricola sp.]